MQIGKYNIHSIKTGTFALDGGAMFSIVPKTIWSRKIEADDKNRIVMEMRALLICGEGRNILVDTGIGDKFSKKHSEIYKIDQSNANTELSLKKHGLAARDITDVILTHLHFDHAGGATRMVGGELIPAFPNANYHIQKAHLSLAKNPTDKDIGSFRKENFEPLESSGRLKVVEGEFEIFPNIFLLIYNGHTTGQQIVNIADGKDTVVYCADLVPTASHIPTHYIMSYDLYPLTAIEEKKQFLTRAAKEGWALFFEHDPCIEAVKIVETDKGFAIKEKIVL